MIRYQERFNIPQTIQKGLHMFKRSQFLSYTLLLSAVVLLPGCNPFSWVKEKVTGSCSCCGETDDSKVEGVDPELLKEAVVMIGDSTAVTGKDVEAQLKMIFSAQPAFKDMLPYLQKEQRDQIFGQIIESLAMEKIMERWVKESGTEKKEEYAKNAARVHKAVDHDLRLRAFENEILKDIKSTEEDAKEYYNTKRALEPMFQRQPFATSVGGVNAEGFEVVEAEAAKLLAKAKMGDFKQVAKDAKKAVLNFGMVNASSFIDPELRTKILSVTKFPSVELIKGADGKWRIVKMSGKKETAYAPFEQVKDAVKQVLMQKKFTDAYTKKMAELKDAYKVEIKKDYIAKREESMKKAEAAKAAEAPKADAVKAPAAEAPKAAQPQKS